MPSNDSQDQPKIQSPQPGLRAQDLRYQAKWRLILGAVFAGITLVFFMLLVVAAIFFDCPVPNDARFLVIVVLALGAAMSAGFLGGAAAMKGKIPIPIVGPFASKNPATFGVGGGVAVLLLVLLLGYFLYVKPATKLDYVVIQVPACIKEKHRSQVASTSENISDFSYFTTDGNQRLLYVNFGHNEDKGIVSFSYQGAPNDVHIKCEVHRKGTAKIIE